MIILKNKTLKIKNKIMREIINNRKKGIGGKVEKRWHLKYKEKEEEKEKNDKEQERKFKRKKVVLENIEKRYFDFVL